jgi:hypothetical protein
MDVRRLTTGQGWPVGRPPPRATNRQDCRLARRRRPAGEAARGRAAMSSAGNPDRGASLGRGGRDAGPNRPGAGSDTGGPEMTQQFAATFGPSPSRASLSRAGPPFSWLPSLWPSKDRFTGSESGRRRRPKGERHGWRSSKVTRAGDGIPVKTVSARSATIQERRFGKVLGQMKNPSEGSSLVRSIEHALHRHDRTTNWQIFGVR